MARPKGTGGRSAYDKYRKFGRRKATTKRNTKGQFTKGKASHRLNKGHAKNRFERKSRFSR